MGQGGTVLVCSATETLYKRRRCKQADDPTPGGRKGNKGALRMRLGLRRYSGAGRRLACPRRVLVLGARSPWLSATRSRMRRSSSDIVVAGQPARRGRHHPLLFPARSGRAARRRRDRRGLQGALRHRPVPGRADQPGGRPAHRHRGRESGHQPRRLRRQQEGQGRAARSRNPVEAARHAVASDGAGRRAAHRRDLSPQRPLRRPRRAEDHRAAEQPRRSRLRNQRRREDRRRRIDFVGNRAYSSTTA